jgi:amino acid transporter
MKAASTGPGVFVRQATGLVRNATMWDAFWMNSIGMALGIGVGLMFFQGPYLFPGGDAVIATIVTTVVTAFTFIYVYAKFSAAMPRSGGDYVFVSRALHPFLGWLLAWSQGIWLIFFWVGFGGWFMATGILPVALNTLSVSLNLPILAQWASAVGTPPWTIGIGVVIIAAFCAILIPGGRFYWRYQKGLVFLMYFSLLLAGILLAVHVGDYASQWNAFVARSHQGIPYNDIITRARSLGFHYNGGFNLVNTISLVPLVFFVVGYAQGSAQIGAEVRQPARSQFIAMVIACLINGAALALLGWLLINATSNQWLASLGFLAFQHPDVLALANQPYYQFLTGILTTSPIILILMALGYIAWGVGGLPLSMLQATRYMLAWSLDGLVPNKLGEVSDRWHTPVPAIILCFFTGVATLILLTFNSTASLLGSLMAQVIAYILVSLAGIVFPYRLRDVYQSSGPRSVFGVPLVTWAGLGGLIFLLIVLAMFIIFPVFGATGTLSLIVTFGIFFIGAIWYFAARYIQRGRGIDIGLAMKEIPPE